MGVMEMKCFETRSKSVLRIYYSIYKLMLLLINRTIIQDLVNNKKESNIYALLTDEVTDI